MIYTYSTINDTKNSKLNLSDLMSEIEQSSIVKSISRMFTDSDVLSLEFSADLQAEEKVVLDAVIGAHEGNPKVEVIQPQQVEISNTPQFESIKGNGTFETLLTHDLTDSPQTYVIAPLPNMIYRIEKAEVQFSKDIKMASASTPTELYFDVWVYNPLFDQNSPIDADDAAFVPGVSSGNPLRFLYERQIYTSIKDVFNRGNEHFHAPYPFDGMTHEISTVQFNYPKWIELKSSIGAQIRVSTKHNLPLEGEFCTISFLVGKVDE